MSKPRTSIVSLSHELDIKTVLFLFSLHDYVLSFALISLPPNFIATVASNFHIDIVQIHTSGDVVLLSPPWVILLGVYSHFFAGFFFFNVFFKLC